MLFVWTLPRLLPGRVAPGLGQLRREEWACRFGQVVATLMRAAIGVSCPRPDRLGEAPTGKGEAAWGKGLGLGDGYVRVARRR